VAKQAGEKRKAGAPDEKEAKRQRTGEAEKEALRLHFKRQKEELKEQELKVGGCGVAARKCRPILDPSCVELECGGWGVGWSVGVGRVVGGRSGGGAWLLKEPRKTPRIF
jgi:hypothetical protein